VYHATTTAVQMAALAPEIMDDSGKREDEVVSIFHDKK
jgi:hypothetical protein